MIRLSDILSESYRSNATVAIDIRDIRVYKKKDRKINRSRVHLISFCHPTGPQSWISECDAPTDIMLREDPPHLIILEKGVRPVATEYSGVVLAGHP